MSASSGAPFLYAAHQKDNPVLKSVRRVPLVPAPADSSAHFDFMAGAQQLPILFLSLRFHVTYPAYLAGRIEALAPHVSEHRAAVLLCHVDLDGDQFALESALESVSLATTVSGVRLFLAWSLDEAGRILETFHSFGQDRAGEIARGATTGPSNSASEVEVLAREAILALQGGIGPKDAAALLNHFGSIRKFASVPSVAALREVPSVGVKKAKHIFQTLHQPLGLN